MPASYWRASMKQALCEHVDASQAACTAELSTGPRFSTAVARAARAAASQVCRGSLCGPPPCRYHMKNNRTLPFCSQQRLPGGQVARDTATAANIVSSLLGGERHDAACMPGHHSIRRAAQTGSQHTPSATFGTRCRRRQPCGAQHQRRAGLQRHCQQQEAEMLGRRWHVRAVDVQQHQLLLCAKVWARLVRRQAAHIGSS